MARYWASEDTWAPSDAAGGGGYTSSCSAVGPVSPTVAGRGEGRRTGEASRERAEGVRAPAEAGEQEQVERRGWEARAAAVARVGREEGSGPVGGRPREPEVVARVDMFWGGWGGADERKKDWPATGTSPFFFFF